MADGSVIVLNGVDDLPGLAALEDGDDQLLVLLGQLADALGRRGSSSTGLDLDPQGGAGAGHAAADAGAAAGAQDGRGRAAAEAADLLDVATHAVRRVAVLEPRRDQQPSPSLRCAGGVDRGLRGLVELDRDDHAGQQHDVGEEQHREAPWGLSHVFTSCC